jgi:uncharacterized membrane protein (DUF106 family)
MNFLFMAAAFLTGGMASVLDGLTTLTSVVGEVFSMITGNPILVVFLAAALMGVAIRMFKKLRGAAGG